MSAEVDKQQAPVLIQLAQIDSERSRVLAAPAVQPPNGSSPMITSGAPRQEILTAEPVRILKEESRGRTTTRSLPCPLDVVHIDFGERILITGATPEGIIRTSERCHELGLPVAIDTAIFPTLRRALGRRLGALDVVALEPVPPTMRLASRARDLIFALAALVALIPIFLVIALCIVFTSGMPIFYCAEVIGRDGRPFRWRKFRSMSPVSPAEDRAWRQAQYSIFMGEGTGSVAGSALKKVGDLQRVTKFGAILRKHSLDELPQFWNVLTGDMTLVGPRPALPYEHDMFADWQRLRVSGITPGLTGPWQAYGRSRVSFDEMILMDYCYGHCRSFLLDIRLILRTIVVMVTGEGGR